MFIKHCNDVLVSADSLVSEQKSAHASGERQSPDKRSRPGENALVYSACAFIPKDAGVPMGRVVIVLNQGLMRGVVAHRLQFYGVNFGSRDCGRGRRQQGSP